MASTGNLAEARDAPGAGAPLMVGWFSSGRGEGSYGLLKAALDTIESDDLPVKIAFVFINRVKGQTKRTDRFLELVDSHDIPLVTLSSRDFRRSHGNRPWNELREEFDRAAIELLRPHSAAIAVHAGYMLIAPERSPCPARRDYWHVAAGCLGRDRRWAGRGRGDDPCIDRRC